MSRSEQGQRQTGGWRIRTIRNALHSGHHLTTPRRRADRDEAPARGTVRRSARYAPAPSRGPDPLRPTCLSPRHPARPRLGGRGAPLTGAPA